MCAISTPLAQGRESPGEAPNWGKLGSVADKFARFGPLSHLVPDFPQGAPVEGAGLRGRRAGRNIFSVGARRDALFPTARPLFAMTDESPKNREQHSPRGDEARQDRLKAKLRENLKRRKSQVRERGRLSSDGHQDCPDGEVGNSDA
jgi:hypothetical protein